MNLDVGTVVERVNFDVESLTLRVDQFIAQDVREWPFADRPRLDVIEDRDIERMRVQHVIRMMVRVPYEPIGEFKYPATWVEAVKARFAPEWLKRRWPVRYVDLEVRAYYPKISLPLEGGRFVRVTRVDGWPRF